MRRRGDARRRRGIEFIDATSPSSTPMMGWLRAPAIRRITASSAPRSRCSRRCRSSRAAASSGSNLPARSSRCAPRRMAASRSTSTRPASILAKARVTEAALACGPHLPMHEPSAEAMRKAGESPGRIHNNCSGKHAGMLAHCVQQQWVTDGYHRFNHPMQQRVVSTLSRWMRIESERLRQGHRRLRPADLRNAARCGGRRMRAGSAAAAAAAEPAPATIFNAMVMHPEYVAGTDRLDTDLMRIANRRLFAKVGAEGFYCAGVPAMKLGVALKVEDGAKRAAEPALLAVLHRLSVIGSAELEQLGAGTAVPTFSIRATKSSATFGWTCSSRAAWRLVAPQLERLRIRPLPSYDDRISHGVFSRRQSSCRCWARPAPRRARRPRRQPRRRRRARTRSQRTASICPARAAARHSR